MTVAVESSGTQTAVIGTEHELAAPTSANTRQFVVDLSNMAAGDTLELRIKRKILTGGVIRVLYYQRYLNAQPTDDLIATSIPVAGPFGTTFSLKQTAGTGRDFAWSVETL